MANKEHLGILKQGVEVWNKWREENSQITNPDLSGADLKSLDLNWINLSGADLGDADLSEAKLVWANFNEATLSNAKLVKADLSKATFNDANLSGADLSEAKLERANLQGATLENANLEGADLDSAKVDLDTSDQQELQVGESQETDDENSDKPIEATSDIEENEPENAEKDAVLKEAENENPVDETVVKEEVEEEIEDVSGKAESELPETAEETIVSEEKPEKKTPEKKTAKKNPNLKWMIAASVIVIAGILYFIWNSLHHDMLIVVPKDANPYVYFDDKLITPTGEEGDKLHYYLKNEFGGEHRLKVYATQLRDLATTDFTRYKLYEETITLEGGDEVQQHDVEFETLYSITHIADGKFPNINADGTKIVFVKTKPVGTKGQFSKDLFIYDLAEKKETRIALTNKTIYGGDWEWDRPYLHNNDDHIFLSAYSFKSQNSYIYIIEAETGNIKRIPLNLRKSYLKYLPLKEPQGLLVENKIYSLSGKHKQSFSFAAPFQDEVFYAGNNGFMFLNDKKLEGSRSFTLECTYINLEKMQAKVLFEVPKNRPPFLSASKDAQKVAVSDYSGITVQFFSTIKLWADNEFAPLTNEFVDGERDYSDGTKVHKTEACADDLVQNIVFEYENKIYLINIPEANTIQDLVNANLKEKAISYADTRFVKNREKG